MRRIFCIPGSRDEQARMVAELRSENARPPAPGGRRGTRSPSWLAAGVEKLLVEVADLRYASAIRLLCDHLGVKLSYAPASWTRLVLGPVTKAAQRRKGGKK